MRMALLAPNPTFDTQRDMQTTSHRQQTVAEAGLMNGGLIAVSSTKVLIQETKTAREHVLYIADRRLQS